MMLSLLLWNWTGVRDVWGALTHWQLARWKQVIGRYITATATPHGKVINESDWIQILCY